MCAKRKSSRPIYGEAQDQLRRKLLALIDGLEPGARLPGVHVLAQQLESSNLTVLLVQKELVQAGILETRSRSGTYVACRDVNKPIALVTSHDLLQPQASKYCLYLMGEVRQRLSVMGYVPELYIGQARPWEVPPEKYGDQPLPPPPDSFLKDLEGGKLGGVVLLSANASGWMDQAERQGLPVVGTSLLLPRHVKIAHEQSIAWAVRRLVEQGRRRLALMTWVDSVSINTPAECLFIDVFTAELRRHGLVPVRDWIAGDFHPTRPEAGAHALRELWTARREKFDGLVITDDVLGRTALPAIARLGSGIERRLSVACHANQDDTLHAPFPISWMRADRSYLCDGLVQMLLARTVTRQPEVRVQPVSWVESSTWSDAPANALVHEDRVEWLQGSASGSSLVPASGNAAEQSAVLQTDRAAMDG